MSKQDDRQSQDSVRQALERDLEELDVYAATRLAAARRRALDELRPARQWQLSPGWALAASVVLVLTIWWWRAPANSGISADDYAMLVSGEQIELYEDLEFYDWLGNENDAT